MSILFNINIRSFNTACNIINCILYDLSGLIYLLGGDWLTETIPIYYIKLISYTLPTLRRLSAIYNINIINIIIANTVSIKHYDFFMPDVPPQRPP